MIDQNNEAAVLEPVDLKIGGDARVRVHLATGSDSPPVFCMGIRKSGSSMLHSSVTFLARRNGVNVVDLPGTFFKNGIPPSDWGSLELDDILRPGNLYIGFRMLPGSLKRAPAFQSAKKIFMFRDPRDAIVSQYFSDAYSHQLPSAKTEQGAKAAQEFMKKRTAALETDINEYVVKHGRSIATTMQDYVSLLSDPNCLVCRYEDYIFQKRRLFNKILMHFGWKCHPGQMDKLLEQVDKVPDGEDNTKFVRRVIPGDHKRKLDAQTIKKLNKIMQETLATYDYY